VEKTEDVLNRGDITRVKLLSIDEKGRLRLSRKAALAEDAAGGAEGGAEEAGNGADGEADADENKSEEAQG
jgi:polyribonucleotide nucleotidyltransferase